MYIRIRSHSCGDANLQGRLAGWGPRGQLQFKFKGDLLAEFPFHGEVSLCSIKAFDPLAEVHPHYGGNMFYSKSTDFNVTLIQKHLHRYIQNSI